MLFRKLRDLLIIIAVSTIALALSMHLSLFIDESFTMSLIRHSYRAVISLDAMDVHPPLYYLILKLFLHVFTLGSQDITVNVVMARLFSFACVVTSFIFACLTLNVMKLRYNAGVLYTLLMIMMLYVQEVTSIRMYPLATLFVVLEFYNLVKFAYRHQSRYLIALTGFAILAAYTHDYAAVIAGLFILFAFLHALFKRSHDAHKWFVAGVAFFVAYLPWLKISFDQALNLPSHYWILMINSLRDSLVFITLLLFACPIVNSFKRISPQNQFIYRLILNVSITMLVIELVLNIHQPVFIIRYVCPLLFVYITVTAGLLHTLRHRSPKRNNTYTAAIVSLFLAVMCINAIYVNAQYQAQFHYQTTQLNRTFRQPNRRVHVNIKKATQGNVRHLCQFNTYAQYLHRHLPKGENALLYKNDKLKQGTNPKLMKKLWNTNP